MDRVINYIGAVPRSVDLLSTNKNAMVALGFLMQAVLGTSVSADGLACTPHTPANLTVNVGPGVIHSLQNIDGTAYGALAADTTNQIMKQGISPSTVPLNCPAPATTGQSINYLVQVAYQDTDSEAAVLPYYNASNPSVPWAGPNNTGVSQNTVRKGVCLVGVKAGIPATTGSQATPAPDAGYTGLYVVTVANGQTTITSGNIAQLTTAPFISAKLPAMLSTIQSGAVSFAQDTSGAANTISITLSPNTGAPTNGQRVAVKVANSVTGATVLNMNSTGNVAVVTTSGAALSANAMVANGIYTLAYDANGNRWQLQGFTAASATGLIPANNLTDVSDRATALNNLMPSQTGNAKKKFVSNGTDVVLVGSNVYQANPSDPAGTSDTTGKMMGLAVPFTPNLSGNCLVVASGDMANTNSISGGAAQIRYGTGSAPANGAALTGSVLGGKVKLTEVEISPDSYPFALNGIVAGLTAGTPYWFDIALAAVGAGTVIIENLSLSIVEIH